MTPLPEWAVHGLAGLGAWFVVSQLAHGALALLTTVGAWLNADRIAKLEAELAQERGREQEREERVDDTLDRMKEFMRRLEPHATALEAPRPSGAAGPVDPPAGA